MQTILVVNSGSSSVKFQVFGTDGVSALERLIKGQVSGIGTMPRLFARDAGGELMIDRAFDAAQIGDVSIAIQTAGAWLREQLNITPIAVGHRIVHGGPDYDRPILIDDNALAVLEKLVCLAPLHQPNNLAPIRSIRARFPDLPQIGCFDTAFHRTHSADADHYAIPEQYYLEGVRRYGFHGLSYEYIADRLTIVAPDVALKKIVVAHLGSGASMCALSGGRSIDSSMGFTALDGVPMGTRPGQLDPGVVLYLIEQRGMSPAAVQDMLYHDCGLKGLSGLSNDVRDLEASDDPRAAFALDYFVYRVGLYAGMLAAALGGIDAFVFTAGIGENSATMRARIADKLKWLGVDLDPAANATHAELISEPRSPVRVYRIATDEEMMIARHTLACLSESSLQRSERGRVA
ncbi:MAG: acetate/propionate family kinase [Pseudomonadota bacterium]